MCFLKKLMCLHTWLAAEMYLPEVIFLRVAVNREKFLKLQGKTRMQIISKRDGQRFKLE